jgi:hypothetical protein
MASTALVTEDIERGREALEALREAGVRPKTAFWSSVPSSSDWRLFMSVPTLNQEGPRRIYERIQRIFKEGEIKIPVWRVTLISTDDPLARWARDRVRLATGDVRSTGDYVEDQIQDAYIYKRL